MPATNPANLCVNYPHYLRCYPRDVWLIALFLVFVPILIGLAIYYQSVAPLFICLGFLVLWGGFIAFFWSEVRDHFRHGNVNPAVVVSDDPYLVAVYTDMTMGAGSWPAIKVLRQPLERMTGGPPTLGQRLATAAMYTGHPLLGHWSDFDPRVVNCATCNTDDIQRVLASIPPDEWDALDAGLRTIVYPKRPGLYYFDYTPPRRSEPEHAQQSRFGSRRTADRERAPAPSSTNNVRVELLVLLGVFLAGGVGMLLCCGALFFSGAGGNDQPWTAARVNAPDPNDLSRPDPSEGPAPVGWVVLFRSDNPGQWNTDHPGVDLARPARQAHSTIRYLRLTRVDSGEYLIVPVTRAGLLSDGRPNPANGHWWNGTNHDKWGGRHLGIVQIPPEPAARRDAVCLTTDDWVAYLGSGFGHKYGKNDRQYFSWQGKEILRTAFEVAVTCDPLTDEEARFLK